MCHEEPFQFPPNEIGGDLERHRMHFAVCGMEESLQNVLKMTPVHKADMNVLEQHHPALFSTPESSKGLAHGKIVEQR